MNYQYEETMKFNNPKTLRLGHGLFIVSALFIFLLTGFFIPYKNTLTSPPSINQVTEKIEKQRNLLSLSPLTSNASLMNAAQSQAEDMARSTTFSYSMPDGRTSWDYIKKAGVIYSSASMIEAVSDESTDRIINGWSKNPIQYDAYTSSSFTDIGVGIANVSKYPAHPKTRVIVVMLTNQQQNNHMYSEIPAGGITLLSPWYFKVNTTLALIVGFIILAVGVTLEILYIKKLHKQA